jgi:hypothetical protein
MPKISPIEFQALPLHVHTLLSDVPLHDVWAVDLTKHRNGVTLDEFLRRVSEGKTDRGGELKRLPLFARMLFGIRIFLGRIFKLEGLPKGAQAASFRNRISAEDRARSLVAPGTREGSFQVVYRFENEQLLEVQNRTVHAAALSALIEQRDVYRFYFAVYVREGSWITSFYMSLIDPFRKWIIYPALLRKISATWDQNVQKDVKRRSF